MPRGIPNKPRAGQRFGPIPPPPPQPPPDPRHAPPPIVAVPVAAIDRKALDEAYKWMAKDQILGFRMVVDWYAKNQIALMRKRQPAPEQQARLERAQKSINHGNSPNIGDFEKIQAWRTGLRILDAVWGAGDATWPTIDAFEKKAAAKPEPVPVNLLAPIKPVGPHSAWPRPASTPKPAPTFMTKDQVLGAVTPPWGPPKVVVGPQPHVTPPKTPTPMGPPHIVSAPVWAPPATFVAGAKPKRKRIRVLVGGIPVQKHQIITLTGRGTWCMSGTRGVVRSLIRNGMTVSQYVAAVNAALPAKQGRPMYLLKVMIAKGVATVA